MDFSGATRSLASRRLSVASVCAVVLSCAYLAVSAVAMGAAAGTAQSQTGQSGAGQEPSASATVEQCVPAAAQSERSAVFAGDMTAMSGSVRMAIRIEIQEQISGEALFHTITAPGLGVWRVSDPGVKTYRYLKQVTNLFAPASYRARVRFHWLNAKGRLMRSNERHTPKCRQPPATPFPASASSEAGFVSVAG